MDHGDGDRRDRTFGRQLMRSIRPRRDGSLRSMPVIHGRLD
jgi:hypothetical protein